MQIVFQVVSMLSEFCGPVSYLISTHTLQLCASIAFMRIVLNLHWHGGDRNQPEHTG